MPTYLIVGQHSSDQCPSANETVRKIALEGAQELPALAEKLGVKLLATYVPMISHRVIAAVEADDANAVRELAWQGRLAQWNTVEIMQTSTLEEALGRVQQMPAIY